ncbi:protein of unknown function [Candidatus Hydrogenisulfobacillus filiaventi]|uniref:Uncharacterized protein n=1 Tax=Candidatus Hydrogenisulfobacillus filiaventi TaxID=2707344 RepID=A0A6F8ZIQ3_9FIRM|nr:protein of unknown function [Candidatus Hydrogenisulfobacillus filiaventi]
MIAFRRERNGMDHWHLRLFGDDHHDPDPVLLLALIGLRQAYIDRFRSAWWDDGRIVVGTRTGGPNREFSTNETLTTNPHYCHDLDDEDDPSYAYFEFEVSGEIAADVEHARRHPLDPVPERLRRWLERAGVEIDG